MPKHSAALLSRIQRRFPTVTDRLRFGAVEIAFTRVADPNRVLDEVAAEEDRREKNDGVRHTEPLHLPYWAELWDSGGGIAMHLANRWGDRLAGKNVLDLGCGQGLAGCIAAKCGACVTFADLEAPALLFAAFNASRISSRIRTRRLNWQHDHLNDKFDLIIGADILYERSQWMHLESFWKAHLAAAGVVVLGEPGRPTGDDFVTWIKARGWSLETTVQPVTTRDKPIRIFELALELAIENNQLAIGKTRTVRNIST
jgi:predicted nicotinamide N-methyase